MPVPSSPRLAHDLAAVADRLRRHTVALTMDTRGSTPERWRHVRPVNPREHGAGIVWRGDGLIVDIVRGIRQSTRRSADRARAA